MVLSFSQTYPQGKTLKGKPTNFKPKIRAGIKIHTMREDKNNRWKVGMSIQLAHGVRTKYYDCFMEAVCTRIDTVRIEYKGAQGTPEVFINDRRLGIFEMILLATNDGFDSFAEFLEWFCVSGTYRLIHWTEFVYTGDRAQLDEIQQRQARAQRGELEPA